MCSFLMLLLFLLLFFFMTIRPCFYTYLPLSGILVGQIFAAMVRFVGVLRTGTMPMRMINACDTDQIFYDQTDLNGEPFHQSLQTGDILLCSEGGKRSARIIRYFTRSAFNHVAIVVKNPPREVLEHWCEDKQFGPADDGVYGAFSSKTSFRMIFKFETAFFAIPSFF